METVTKPVWLNLKKINSRKFFARLYAVVKSKRGELPAVAIFGFFLVQDLRALLRYALTMRPVGFLSMIVFLNGLFVTLYFTMLVCIYLTRGTASVTTKSLPTKLIAFAATFMPFTFPMLSGPAPSGISILLISSLILFFAMIFTLLALGALGRSFSLIPQARKLVTTGPYRFVRHPVYVGEILGALGLVVWACSIPKVLVFLVLIGCEVYRALQEENLLREAFCEYDEYAGRTKRFIPGIF
ncbi:MAG: methyltransferase family protein [Syntrophobacteraceae bacterium]